jgi:hypothetical protein
MTNVLSNALANVLNLGKNDKSEEDLVDAQHPPIESTQVVTEDTPQIIISFANPAFPTFIFTNWRAGVSMGTIERCGQLLIREAMKQQALLMHKRRTEEHEAQTQTA